jgi:hypothetical protein
VSGCAFRCVACLVQVLFAPHERYFVNEKGSVKAVSAFPSRPSNFERVTEHLLGHLGHWPPRLGEGIRQLGQLAEEVRTLRDLILQRDHGPRPPNPAG